jgi:hypothetical protein
MEVMSMLVLAGLEIMSSIECVWRLGWERLPMPPSSSCHGSPPINSRGSMLVTRGWDRWSRRRLCFAYEDELLHSAMRIVQYPRPATVVQALVVEIQEAGGD